MRDSWVVGRMNNPACSASISRCTHVVMESTGVYWKPFFDVLESAFEVVLANAQHVKNLPDVKLMSRIANGSRNCCGTVWSAEASFLAGRFVSCEI